MSGLKRLIVEVHRRSLWQILLIYFGGSWIVFEVVQTLTEGLGLPEWFPAFALVLLLIGFPIVLATAFVQEGTTPMRQHDPTLMPSAELQPEGGLPEVGGAKRLFTWRNAITAGALAFGLWGVVATGWLLLGESGASESDKKMLVVLPFENLGATEDEYFADGVTEEITSRIAELSGIGVISRNSAMQYGDTRTPTQQIGRELNVDYILEGTVRWEREPGTGQDRVRVTPQLIRVSDDTHLWTERYDADLAGVFEIQADIAERVAEAMEITLLDRERHVLEMKPTENLEAYNYYLLGNDYSNRSWLEKDLLVAQQMYERALELDPSFAHAYARLSGVHATMYWFYHDRSEERLASIRRAAERALQLQSDLPAAHVAMGFFWYHGMRDYRRALESFAIAERAQPDDPEVLYGIGAVKRRLGEFDGALTKLSRAFELDPLSSVLAGEVAYTHERLGNYSAADDYYDQAISLAPDRFLGYLGKANLRIRWQSDRAQARRVLEEAWSRIEPAPLAAGNLPWQWSIYRTVDSDYERTLDRIASGTFGRDSAAYFVTRAELYDLTRQSDSAFAYYDSARAVLERKTSEYPREPRFHSELGVAYAGLGQVEEAVREGEEAVELLPVSEDAVEGTEWLAYLARIYVMVGDFDAAIEQLEYLLSLPTYVTVASLRVDPLWDPLRDHPRFKALLDK